MKLNSLLALTFGLMTSLAIGLGIYSIWHFYKISAHFDYFYKHPYSVRTSLLHIDAAVDELNDLTKQLIANRNGPINLEMLEKKTAAHNEVVLEDIDLLRKNYLGNLSDIDKIEQVYLEWNKTQKDIQSYLADKDWKKAIESITTGDNARHLVLLRQAIKTCDNFAKNKANQIRSIREDSVVKARNTTIVVVVIVAIIGILSAAFILLHVKKLLGKDPAELDRIAIEVASGNFQSNENTVDGSVHAQLMSIVDICEYFQGLSQTITKEVSRGNLRERSTETDRLHGGWQVMFDQVAKTFDFLTAYLDHLPSPLIIVDTNLQTLYRNDAATALVSSFAPEYESTTKIPICELLCDEDSPCSKAVQDGETHHATGSYIVRGRKKYYNIISTPVIDIEGNLAGAATIFTDVTKQAETMEQLRRSEEVFNDAQRIGRVGAWEWFFNEDNAILTDEAYRIYGYEIGDEVRNDDFKSRVHPDDFDSYLAALKHVIDTGQEQIFQFRYYHPVNGELRHIETRAGVGQVDEDGTIISLRGVVADISELEITKQELDRQNQFIMTILDNLPVGIAVNKSKVPFAFTYINQMFLHLFNIEATPPRNVAEFWKKAFRAPCLREEIRAAVEADFASNDRRRLQWENIPITDSDDNVRYISAKTIALPTIDIIVAWDVDAQHKALQAAMESRREAESANEAKSIFLANMSHEIRTPLNVVLGFAQLLAEDVSDVQRREYAHAIQASGTALLELINDILEISKIEFSKIVIRPRPVSISMLLDELYTIFYQTAKEKGLEFKTVVDHDIPVLMLDGPRLRQILINLAGNAIKFTEQGSIEIQAKAKQESDRCQLDIAVLDTGIGIPADQKERVFNLFEQQESQDLSRFGGTGLGLAISKHIADLMGGSISLESEPGKGSTFTLHLHNIPLAEDDEIEPESTTSDIPKRFQPVNALVVDDIPSNRIVLAAMLHTLGLHVETAENGAEALSMAEMVVPDIILTDQRMPIMDGKELARHINSRPELRHIPVIAVTATHELESVELSELFNDVLPKPINRVNLVHMLAKYIEPVEPEEDNE